MPELPDVERFRTAINSNALHKKIKSVQVSEKRVLDNVSEPKLKRALKGAAFEKTRRHGKYLFLQLDKGGFLVLHFGMTGDIRYYKSDSDRPEHTRMLIEFANGYRLAWINMRLLGRINVAREPAAFVRARDLGPDAMQIGREQFREAFSGRNGKLKPALMNQSILAGLGNIYTDEILFQSGWHPESLLKRFKPAELDAIHGVMKRVLRVTVRRLGRIEEFPRTYLLPHRDKEGACPRCGSAIRRIKVGQRTSYFCPQCQKKR